MAQVRSGGAVTRALFERAYAYKKGCLERGDPVGGRWGKFYDALIFSKIRAKLGGEVKYMTTGGCGVLWRCVALWSTVGWWCGGAGAGLMVVWCCGLGGCGLPYVALG